ncbi:phosphoribosylanthranilate isomerase [Brevibacillus dissolubilis]|uniref:phosphoribosylanthranilate isomerase n=1 Tax=Brevibacillus dissolubilis TaxID=1844116 RepID=UPI001115B746|nr:phosphoribosylanthranilate isomerase [Brevibacillus dissolubilis]
MTTVKICGIKDVATLQLLKRCGVDYVGFVFAPSKRQVSGTEAGAMLRAVPERPRAVGVFVNPSLEELDEVMAHAPLDVIQLHGQETPGICALVRERYGVEVWKALTVGGDFAQLTNIADYFPHVSAFLFDTHDPKQAGGTGKRFAWSEIPKLREYTGDVPFFVAGGVNEENISELLTNYQPYAVDISSGVETDGVKDHAKIKHFVERVRVFDTQ